MEFFDKIRERFIRESSVVHKYKPETRDFSGIDAASLGDSDWWHLQSAVRERNTNIFKELKIEDNPKNRVKIIASYLKTRLGELWPELINQDMDLDWDTAEDIQVAEHTFNTVFTDLGFLIEGRKFDIESQYFDKHNSYRHSERTAWISEIILEEIFERSKNKDLVAQEAIKQIPLGALYASGFLHDIGRLITQTSAHDSYGEEILKQAGIRSEVISCVHSPVSPDVGYKFSKDSNGQRIVRLADVFAKVAVNENGEFMLRNSIDEVSKYSLERQTIYWKKEHDNPNSFWCGKTMDDVRQYCVNERSVLEQSEKWLQSMGINLQHLVHKINDGIGGLEGQYYRGRP